MSLLILGLILWFAAHLFKRIAPERRAAMGDKGRGPIALALFVSLALMVIGYRMADGAVLWGRHPAAVGINNILMLMSVYLFAAAGAKTALAQKIRHPMLTAVKFWATAHLLVNGDIPSFVLFGGLFFWALIEVVVINRAEPDWTPPPDISMAKEIRAGVIALVIFAAIAGIHYALGYPAFG